ncbi:MAG: hypothetical protein WCK91_03550 [bacterium]
MDRAPKLKLILGDYEKSLRIEAFVNMARERGFFSLPNSVVYSDVSAEATRLEEVGITREELADALEVEKNRLASGSNN